VLVVLQGLATSSVEGRKELEGQAEIRVMVEMVKSCGSPPVENAAKATLAALDGPQPEPYEDDEDDDDEGVADASSESESAGDSSTAAAAHGPEKPPAPPAADN
jgi:hypothetical protein